MNRWHVTIYTGKTWVFKLVDATDKLDAIAKVEAMITGSWEVVGAYLD